MVVDFNLYLITDRRKTKGRYLVEVAKDALQGGVKAIQLREKDLNAADLLKLARRMRGLTREYGARLFLNDRIDIAIAVDSDGVHLGQSSFSPRDTRGLLGGDKLIGVSTHSLKEAKSAEAEGADFITLGPIFYTPSKVRYGEPLGIDIIKAVKAEIGIPVFPIGGIRKKNLDVVMGTGADGVAAISAIMSAEEPEVETMEMVGDIERLKKLKQVVAC
jgi:thiamine-phosphate pyrophosphorylase